MTRTLKTITVFELSELLKGADPDARVIFSADYGDHCHTTQALPIRGDLEPIAIRETAYSASGWAVADADEAPERPADDNDEPAETFLVIR